MTCLNWGQLTRFYAVDDPAERWTLIVLYMKNVLNFHQHPKEQFKAYKEIININASNRQCFLWNILFFNQDLLTFAFSKKNNNPVLQFQIITTLTHQIQTVFCSIYRLEIKMFKLYILFTSTEQFLLLIDQIYSCYCLKLQFIIVVFK